VNRSGMTTTDITWTATNLILSGNVGVGVNPPVLALHVKRSGTVAGFFETTAGSDALTRYKTSNGEFGVGVGIGATTNCLNVWDFSAGVERMRIESTGAVVEYQPHKFGQFTLSTLPSAASFSGYYIDVTNATGGPRLCRSNGTNWIMVYNNAIVS
jgi:hypothetical protein